MVTTINVHCAGATDTFSATATERECGIDLVFDFDQSIEEHRSTFLHIDVIGDILWSIGGIIRISSINVESLHLFLLVFGQTLFILNGVIDLKDFSHIGKACL